MSGDNHCAFFLEKKKRYCRFRPNKDQKYCAEHIGVLGIPTERKRIVCPLDSKHTCYEDQLAKHLKKCRKQQGALPGYHCPGINSGECNSDETDEKIVLSEVSTETLKNLIKKVNTLYDEYVKIPSEILSHSCLNKELGNQAYGIPAIRHRKQQASLIGHLEKMNLIRDNMTYVELGAGKGMLSHWIQKAGENTHNCNYVLVDRGTCRYKADNFHKWEDNGPKFERIRIDIEHLNLGKVKTISESNNPVVAVGKHLCGSATDLAFRCIAQTLTDHTECSEPEEKKMKRSQCKKLGGLSIALCCHHRCHWKPYVGKHFFTNNGFSVRDFNIICKLTSWTAATWSGWKSVQEMKTALGVSETNSEQTYNSPDLEGSKETQVKDDSSLLKNKERISADDMDSSDSEADTKRDDENHTSFKREDLTLSYKEREEIGRKCKRLIDYGRLEFLREQGLNSDMKVYIEEQLTPENVAIFATLTEVGQ